MKKLGYVALMMGLLAPPAIAAHVEFRGTMCITSVGAGCPAGDWNVNACYALRYRPPNLGDNGASTRFGFYGDGDGGGNFAYMLILNSGSLVGTTFKPVSQTTITSFDFTANPTMRLTLQSPATLTATSRSVTIAGNVDSIDEPGCNLAFTGAGLLVP